MFVCLNNIHIVLTLLEDFYICEKRKKKEEERCLSVLVKELFGSAYAYLECQKISIGSDFFNLDHRIGKKV